VQLAGHKPASTAFSIGEAEEKTLEVVAGPREIEAAGGQTRTLGYALGGVGVAGVGTAIISGVLLNKKKSTVESDCSQKVCATQAGIDAASSGRTLLVVNTAAWIVGAAGLGVGAYFILTSTPASQTSGWIPSVGPNGAGLAYRGAF
jgi:hypothetical protein